MPINRRATLWWWLHLPAARYHDILSGPVVLVGPTGPDGETLDVPASLRHLLLSPLDHFQVEFSTNDVDGWRILTATPGDYFEAAELALDLARCRPEVRDVCVVAPT